jgi:hypothetical protein
MDKKDSIRLKELENFVINIQSALLTHKRMQMPTHKNTIAYRMALDGACLRDIQRTVNKVKK